MEAPVFEKGYPSYEAVNGMGDLKFTTAGDYLMAQDTATVTADELVGYGAQFPESQQSVRRPPLPKLSASAARHPKSQLHISQYGR